MRSLIPLSDVQIDVANLDCVNRRRLARILVLHREPTPMPDDEPYHEEVPHPVPQDEPIPDPHPEQS